MIPRINCYNGFDSLEEVWLGDVWPAHFYDYLPYNVRQDFYKLTEITKQDLTAIEEKIKSFGVTVRRPYIEESRPDLYKNKLGMLYKPPITPRDYGIAIGNTLYFNFPEYEKQCWQYAIDEYQQDKNVSIRHPTVHICGNNIVRCGYDLYIDRIEKNHAQERDKKYIEEFAKDYRLSIFSNGGHFDACLATLRPGVILGNTYYDDYNKSFPNWDHIIVRDNPKYYDTVDKINPSSPGNGKNWHWFIEDEPWNSDLTFNEHVFKHCKDWIGNYVETYFEVNLLVIDHNNIIWLGDNQNLARYLKFKHKINTHSVPFRTRSFWDGGLHCITLDIRRQGTKIDYFPDRKDKGYIQHE